MKWKKRVRNCRLKRFVTYKRIRNFEDVIGTMGEMSEILTRKGRHRKYLFDFTSMKIFISPYYYFNAVIWYCIVEFYFNKSVSKDRNEPFPNPISYLKTFSCLLKSVNQLVLLD